MKRLINVPVALSVCLIAANALAQRKLPVIPPPDQRMRVVIDTDAACEIDDLYAIALAVLCPQRLEIEGFVAAHFGDAGGPDGVEKSFERIHQVLQSAGMEGAFPVKMGSHPFRYSSQPVESEGVDFLIEHALASPPDRPLWVVSLGACTNVAAAYLKRPEIKDHVVVFWHGRTQWPEKCWNFNAYNDLKAVRILFTSELPLVLFDTGTHLTCPMQESQRRINPLGPLGKFLHECRYQNEHFQSPKKGFFDLGDIAALVDPTLVKQEVVNAPGVNWDMLYTRHKTHGKILRLSDVDRDGTFALLYQRLEATYPR